MKSYLITGANGYIGAQYIKYLLENNDDVKIYALVRDIDKLKKTLGSAFSKVEVIVISDIASDKLENIVLEKTPHVDYIIHLAAVTQSAQIVKYPLEVAEGIIKGTSNILNLAVKLKVKTMLFVSSMEVYGNIDCADGHLVEETELGDVDIFKERSAYPLAKRMAEHYCYNYFKLYNLPVKIARLAQTFGKEIQKEDNRVFAQFAKSVINGEDIILHTDGKSIGNYCGINDVMKAFEILLSKGNNGEAYNVVNEANTMSIYEMAQLVIDNFSMETSKVKIEITSDNKMYASHTGLKLSAKKMQSLGWSAKQTLVDMYADAIKSLKESMNIDFVSIRKKGKKIIFYLPYSANMWDCLEDFWRRDLADENTEAFVMPIPYYDKNSEDYFKTMHCEANEFPSDVPVLDYRKYDLKKIHPDSIYIHNPYDNSNAVSSVHPDYYSTALKECTDELVYVPYFIVGNYMYNLEYMKRFSCMPGAKNADKIIVESERVKKLYIDSYALHYGEAEREKYAAKFTECYSSKIEKIKRMKKENIDIPRNWLKHMQKNDGSYKTVILFNNSIATFCAFPQKALNKYRWILNQFYERREEICLLWRPHPLMMSTMQSLHPELLNEYEKIIQGFKDGDWGIYDDTTDLNRAIGISDGYYGDHSSLVQLFHAAGKYCLVNNLDVVED